MLSLNEYLWTSPILTILYPIKGIVSYIPFDGLTGKGSGLPISIFTGIVIIGSTPK